MGQPKNEKKLRSNKSPASLFCRLFQLWNGTMSSGNVRYILIGALVSLSFGSSIFGDFVFDDTEAILVNPDLERHLFDSRIFLNDFWGKRLTDSSSHKSYRPLTILVYKCIRLFSALLYQNGSQQLHPLGFRSANLIAYTLLCCLLHSTLCLFLAGPIIGSSPASAQRKAFLVTLLFAVHPLHTESVASCVGLADILSALFSILAFRVYLNALNLLKVRKNTSTFQAVYIKRTLWSITIVLLIGLALLFKEQGITYLGVFIILNLNLVIFHTHVYDRSVILLQSCFFLISAAAFLYGRLWVMNFSRPSFSSMDNPASHISSLPYRYINFGHLYLLNAFLIVCPIWLCFDWSMGCIPLIESLSDIRFVWLLLFTVTFAVIFSYLIISIRHRNKRCFLVFFAFALLPFLPSSNLFFQVGFVIAERNLFMPLLGYLLIFITAHNQCLYLLPRTFFKQIFHYSVYLLLLTYSIRSFTRSRDWLHEEDLFAKDVSVCPGNAKIFYNIGKIAADRGEIEKAVENYKHSLTLYKNYTSALNNYGNILRDLGQLEKAKAILEKACSIDPQFASGLMNLAIVEMALGNYPQSEAYFKRVIQIRANHAYSHFNMANMYLEWKHFREAEQMYKRAVQLDEKLVRAWNNLILLTQDHKQPQDALQMVYRALEFNADEASLHFLAGNILGQIGQAEKSEEHFKRAISLSPLTAKYHYNLAVLYHRNKRLSDAKEYYQKALSLDPDHRGAKQQLQVLINKSSK